MACPVLSMSVWLCRPHIKTIYKHIQTHISPHADTADRKGFDMPGDTHAHTHDIQIDMFRGGKS